MTQVLTQLSRVAADMIKSKKKPCPLPHRSHAHTYHRDEVTPKHFSEGSQMSKVRELTGERAKGQQS